MNLRKSSKNRRAASANWPTAPSRDPRTGIPKPWTRKTTRSPLAARAASATPGNRPDQRFTKLPAPANAARLPTPRKTAGGDQVSGIRKTSSAQPLIAAQKPRRQTQSCSLVPVSCIIGPRRRLQVPALPDPPRRQNRSAQTPPRKEPRQWTVDSGQSSGIRDQQKTPCPIHPFIDGWETKNLNPPQKNCPLFTVHCPLFTAVKKGKP